MKMNSYDMDALGPPKAAVAQYLNKLCSATKTEETCVFRSAIRDLVAIDLRDLTIDYDLDSAKYVSNNLIDAYAIHRALGVKDSRRFCRVWEVYVMSTKKQVDRCLSPDDRMNYDAFANIFFQHNLNVRMGRHAHWILVVMNTKKQKFQILDSLWTLDMYMDKILELRTGIQRMTAFARKKSLELPKSVGTWEINYINNLPKQTDGHSCGFFVLMYMEHWNGTKLPGDFTQEDVNILRRETSADLIFSTTNELAASREEVEKIMHEMNPPQN